MPNRRPVIRYIPGRFGGRVGDWGDHKQGTWDYAGYGLIRPSPNVPIKKAEQGAPPSKGTSIEDHTTYIEE